MKILALFLVLVICLVAAYPVSAEGRIVVGPCDHIHTTFFPWISVHFQRPAGLSGCECIGCGCQ